MKKWEKEILQNKQKSESLVLYELEKTYKYALEEVKQKVAVLQAKPQTQSVIYQLKYQNALKDQLQEVYDKVYWGCYSSIDKYLKECYEDSFFSTMYGLQKQDIPLILPFPQEEMVQMTSVAGDGIKLSKKIYSDTWELAKITRQEISRGIATGASYIDIANSLEKRSEASFKQAKRIVVTESHRIGEEVQYKTLQKAKEKGADIVKQWDSTLDKKTRKTHNELDGQLREIDQPFKIPSTGATAQFPGGFGIASEDVNCRCVSLQRARWALDKSEVDKMVGDLDGMTDDEIQAMADRLGVDKDDLKNAENNYIKAKNYNEFKKKYTKKADSQKAKLQSQLDVLEQEEKNFYASIGKTKEEVMLFGSADEQAKMLSYNTNILDLQKKLGIQPTKAKPAATPTPTATTTPAQTNSNHDTIMNSAKKFTDSRSADAYHIKNNFNQNFWDNDLTANERNGVVTYTSNFYSQMNRTLRSNAHGLAGEDSKVKKAIDNCTSALEKTKIKEDVWVYRGMGDADALSAWTGIPKASLSDKAVQNSLIGTRLTEKAFMSTGTSQASAWSGINLEVCLPAGSKAMYVDPISHYKGEYEVLVQRNSTFEVKEVKTDSNGYIKGLVLMLIEQKLP